MSEADPRCSQAQFLENDLWVMVVCTGKHTPRFGSNVLSIGTINLIERYRLLREMTTF